MSVEFVDANLQLPIAYRNTIANMMAEGEALNGIFAADDVTYAWYESKGVRELPYPRIVPGDAAHFEIDEALSLDDVQPMIAKPFSPGNAYPAEEVARERIEFDKALIGSCTNGSYDDLLQAALVIYYARQLGIRKTSRTFVVFPGSGGVGKQIERPDQRLGGESIAAVFRLVGGESAPRGAVLVSARDPTRSRKANARLRRSTGTGKTEWVSGGKAISPARPS